MHGVKMKGAQICSVLYNTAGIVETILSITAESPLSVHNTHAAAIGMFVLRVEPAPNLQQHTLDLRAPEAG